MGLCKAVCAEKVSVMAQRGSDVRSRRPSCIHLDFDVKIKMQMQFTWHKPIDRAGARNLHRKKGYSPQAKI